MWPQITVLALYFIGIGSAMAKGRGIGLPLVVTSLMCWLLYEGGFFAPLGWAP